MATLLAFHAHPDDESSKGAATVARYSDQGVRCVLVTATGGEAGDILNPALDTPEVKARLAAIRDEELEKAAAIIGYDEVVRLGYRDSGMPDTEPNRHPDAFTNADRAEALGRIVAVVRRVRPDVMLGYDDHQRYPHPDHLMVHDLSLAAFEAAADPEAFPAAGPPWAPAKLYAPVFTAKRILALHRAMEDRGLESPFARWMERIDEHADETRVVTSVEVGATLERGREALRAHATQIDPAGHWFQVPLELAVATYPFEDFELIASRVDVAAGESDLFAGI
jgi:mycothiol S-conjugate amidase